MNQELVCQLLSIQVSEQIGKSAVSQGEQAVQYAQALIVTNESECAEATEFTKEVKRGLKNLENKRKEYTQPLVDSKKAIDEDFRQYRQPFEEAEKILKKKIGEYKYEILKKQQEEERKLAVIEAEKGVKLEKARKLTEKKHEEEKKTKTDKATSSTRLVWEFEVIDAEKVPIEYRTVDIKKIREAVQNGVREIDGVNIYETTRTIIR